MGRPARCVLCCERLFSRALLFVPLALAALALPFVACDGGSSGSSSTASGQGGEGGCPLAPEPLFTLTLTAADGPVPEDTRLYVRWSAAEEPVFALDDPSTWKSLDEGANVVCNVTPGTPTDELAALVCELWTSGATEVEVTASDYLTQKTTFSPQQSELCLAPVPSDVAMVLSPEADAATR